MTKNYPDAPDGWQYGRVCPDGDSSGQSSKGKLMKKVLKYQLFTQGGILVVLLAQAA